MKEALKYLQNAKEILVKDALKDAKDFIARF